MCLLCYHLLREMCLPVSQRPPWDFSFSLKNGLSKSGQHAMFETQILLELFCFFLKGSDNKYSSSRLEIVNSGPNRSFLFMTQTAEDESNLILNYLLPE